jgi:uncharacterized membrane protein (DUF2068 family)
LGAGQVFVTFKALAFLRADAMLAVHSSIYSPPFRMESSAVQTAPAPAAAVKRTGNQALTAIAIFKLSKAALCLAAAIGMFSMLHHDAQTEIRKLLHVFRISGDREFAQKILAKANLITLPKKKLITVLLGFSSIMFTVEGVGLLLKKPWAEYFTVILTSLGVPIELYEIIHHATGLKFAALTVNLMIVAYLISHLVRNARERKASQVAAAS